MSAIKLKISEEVLFEMANFDEMKITFFIFIDIFDVFILWCTFTETEGL